MTFADASAYDVLWADAVVVEQAALVGGTDAGAVEVKTPKAPKKKAAARKTAAPKAGKKAAALKKQPAAKKPAPKKKKES